MFYIAFTWLLHFVSIVCLGNLVCQGAFRSGIRALGGSVDVFRRFWIGFGFLVAVVQIYSLFMPVDGRCLALVAFLALLGLPDLARRTARTARIASRTGTLWTLPNLLLATAAVVLVLKAASELSIPAWDGRSFDTDLYHFSAVRWANEYPAVPGLANLHTRLAFNSSFLLYSALVDNWIWDLRSAWITHGFILVVVTLQCLHTLVRRDGAPLRSAIFCALVLPYLLFWSTHLWASLHQDRPSLAIQLVLFLEMLRFPFRETSQTSFHAATTGPHRRVVSVVMILLLALLGYTFRPSGMLSCIMALGFVIAATPECFPWRTPSRRVVRWLLAALLLPTCLLSGYWTRSVVMSGWISFPIPIGNLHLSWSVPEHPVAAGIPAKNQSVAGHFGSIKDYARKPGPDSDGATSKGFWYWFPSWYAEVRQAVEPRVFLAGVFAMAGFWLAASRMDRRTHRRELFLAAFILANLLAWFCSAPDLRFADAFFWMWMALGVSSLVCASMPDPRLALGAGLVLLFLCCYWIGADVTFSERSSLWAVGRARPRPTREVLIRNGQTPPLIVHVPADESSGCCGDAPLPCTPYPTDALMMREPGNLRSGFYVKQE